MLTRDLSTELQTLAQEYPVISLLGPRQAGKTTLARTVFPEKQYVNLELPEIRLMAELDPMRFLEKYPEGAILDEIQHLPTLLSYIQHIVDNRDDKGLFILTGSHQLLLHAAITQSLAGRTALLTLLPLSLHEIQQIQPSPSLKETILKGGLPRIYKDQLNPHKAYRNYFQTYVERDVRQLIHVKDLTLFQQFIKLCAGRIGQIMNFQSFSNDLGVSPKTIQHWISILEASFILFQLPPYFENFGKRIIKATKLYFTDVGLASYLLGIETAAQLDRDPMYGYLVENLMILELYKHRFNRGLDPQCYYYRDHHQNEIDVILKMGHQLIPIEIKAAQTFRKEALKGLLFFQSLVKDRCPTGYLIYTGQEEQKIGNLMVLNYNHLIAQCTTFNF
jgi:predicted AAA+ superfamily ATPase